RVLEMQRLARIYQRMDRVRRERGLGETRQDQLELARIGRNVADREDSGARGRAARRIDADVVLLDLEPPSGKRTEIGRQPEKRQQAVGLETARAAGEIGDNYR